MNVTVEGTLLRDAEARMHGRGGWIVIFLIDGGKGLPIEARWLFEDAHRAENVASNYPRGSVVRACGGHVRPRLDHDVAAVLLLDVADVTTV